MSAAQRLATLDELPAIDLLAFAEGTLSALVKAMNEETVLLRSGRFREAAVPGADKTRLAQEAARRQIDAHPGGVSWVDLAALSSPGGIVPAIVHAAYLHLEEGDPLAELARALAHRSTLLVTFEELPDRNAAEAARGILLFAKVDVAESPDDPDEFYAHQLVGLAAYDEAGTRLGEVSALIRGGAQDLLTVRTPDGTGEATFACREDQRILDAALASGVALPFGCRMASCGMCSGRLAEGTIRRGTELALTDGHVKKGFVLLCQARPRSDVVIVTHQETELGT